jgi:hypothetical protein
MANVKVGCKLPHGLTIEMGYTIDKDSNYTRKSAYRRATLNGTNSNLVKGAFATANQAPGVTLVDESLIVEWLKQNAGIGFVKAGMVYIIKNDAEGAAISLDLSKMKTGFEPLDPSKLPKDLEKMTLSD